MTDTMKHTYVLASHAVSADHPVALVLGSGFRGLSGLVKPVRRISYERIEGYVRPDDSAVSQVPEATVGTVDGVPVIAYPARLHLYQGYAAHEVTSLVRHAYSCGCRVAVFVGASGLLERADKRLGRESQATVTQDEEFPMLAVVSDHLNLTGENPLIGWRAVRGSGDSFVPMCDSYDRELRTLAMEVANERGVSLREGVYAEVKGPSLETPAEARMLCLLGADFVGMSLTLEVIMAKALGMRVLALTLPTNPAGASWVSHRSVRAEATSCTRDLETLIRGVLTRL